MIDVRMWFLFNILRMNGQNIIKFCILIITDQIYVGIVMHRQFFKQSYATVYLCPVIALGGAIVRSSDNSILLCGLLEWRRGIL